MGSLLKQFERHQRADLIFSPSPLKVNGIKRKVCSILAEQIQIAEAHSLSGFCVSRAGIVVFTNATGFPSGPSRKARRHRNLTGRSCRARGVGGLVCNYCDDGIVATVF